MAIRIIRPFPLRSQGLAQDDYSTGVENSLTDISGMASDFNAAATVAQLATTTTSSSSVLIGTGAKTFTIPAGLGFVAGMTIRIANSSTSYMTADVTSYSSTTLVVNSTAVIGSGTFASWSISLAAVGANAAGTVSFTPAGNIAATNVQSAIQELDTEKLSSAAGAVTSANLNDIVTGSIIGDSKTIPIITFDSKGRITAATTSPVDNIKQLPFQQLTSGTTRDFTIPANVKKVEIIFGHSSTSGTSNYLIRLGHSGGIESSGYTSGAQFSSSYTSSTSGFLLTQFSSSATIWSGVVTLVNLTSNTWCSTSNFNSGAGIHVGAGYKVLSGALTTVRIETVSGDTFDAGDVGCMLYFS